MLVINKMHLVSSYFHHTYLSMDSHLEYNGITGLFELLERCHFRRVKLDSLVSHW